ncbi:MAG: BolA family transcriptional regulator [Gammaproteobacteria bacterium]|nr:BolA family transcriptional regulator [Gammaproteobacteria bacterium]
MSERSQKIHERLKSAFRPEHLVIKDQSHLHADHAGARDGRGHFEVRIMSDRFNGLRLVQRHQLVYQALGELMQTDIHALSIHALSPGES